MPKWVVKAGIQKLIAACPGSFRINEFLQERITGTLNLPMGDFLEHLSWDARHVASLRAAGRARPGFTAFELGTGWLPIFGITLFLSGAGRIVTVDRTPTLKLPRVMRVIQRFVELADDGRLDEMLPGYDPRRLTVLRCLLQSPPIELDALLAELRIEFLTSPTALQDFPDAYFDLISTVGVLQYIDRGDLDALLKLLARKLSPGGVTCHLVDLRDQFAVSDPSISKLNFLRFSRRQWEWIRNSIIPNSRVRFGEYLDSFRAAGLQVSADVIERLDKSELQRVKLHPDFAHCPPEDLLMGMVHFNAALPDEAPKPELMMAAQRRPAGAKKKAARAGVRLVGSVSTLLAGYAGEVADLLSLVSLA